MDKDPQRFNQDPPKTNESEGEYLANDCRDQRCPQCGQGIRTTMACLIWFARSVVIVNQAAVLRDKNESAPLRSELDE